MGASRYWRWLRRAGVEETQISLEERLLAAAEAGDAAAVAQWLERGGRSGMDAIADTQPATVQRLCWQPQRGI